MLEKIEVFLASYLERMRPIYRPLDQNAAHRIALAFLSFKHGLFEEAVQRSDQALEALGRSDGSPAVRTAIASLAPRRNIDGVLRQEELQDFFDAIITIENIERIKPDPEVFLKAAEALNVLPSECVAIEDSDRGVAAAVAAGMTTVALTTTLPADRLRHAHLVVPKLADVTLAILQEVHRSVP